jgi:hypothetical protein
MDAPAGPHRGGHLFTPGSRKSREDVDVSPNIPRTECSGPESGPSSRLHLARQLPDVFSDAEPANAVDKASVHIVTGGVSGRATKCPYWDNCFIHRTHQGALERLTPNPSRRSLSGCMRPMPMQGQASLWQNRTTALRTEAAPLPRPAVSTPCQIGSPGGRARVGRLPQQPGLSLRPDRCAEISLHQSFPSHLAGGLGVLRFPVSLRARVFAGARPEFALALIYRPIAAILAGKSPLQFYPDV